MEKYTRPLMGGAIVLGISALALISVPSTSRYVRASPVPDAAPETVTHGPGAESAQEPVPARARDVPAKQEAVTEEPAPRFVPFYSQFKDITSPEWKKVGCGAASLAMIIDYYRSGPISVDALVKDGSAQGAYLSSAGWTYKGLIELSHAYGLAGESYDLAGLEKRKAFDTFKAQLAEGPVIASVHYQFDPSSTIPHLVVIDALEGDTLYYNDPAAGSGGASISVDDFLKAWKSRYIVIRPA